MKLLKKVEGKEERGGWGLERNGEKLKILINFYLLFQMTTLLKTKQMGLIPHSSHDVF